jgi:hypothetical protein
LLEEHLALRERVPANPVGLSIQQQGPHKAFGEVELEPVHEVVNVLVAMSCLPALSGSGKGSRRMLKKEYDLA